MMSKYEKLPLIERKKIEKDLKHLENCYDQFQDAFVIYEVDKSIGKKLVDSQQNLSRPIHSWYVLKEAFSYELPTWVVNKIRDGYNAKIKRVLDPFLGSGTTGVALSAEGLEVDGVEYNPFIRFVALTKANARCINKEKITIFIEYLKTLKPNPKNYLLPELSTFHERKYFRQNDIKFLLQIIDEIQKSDLTEIDKNFLKLGVANSLSLISNLRKDGRALRFVKKKSRPTSKTAVLKIWMKMLDSANSDSGSFSVFKGTAKDLANVKASNTNANTTIASNNYDLVLYSPPYLNNFDYSEIYKLELWLLGFIKNYDDWYILRKNTLRSHHSLKFKDYDELFNNPILKEVAQLLQFMKSSNCLVGYAAKNMPSVISGYFDDLYKCLSEQYRILRPGGFLVYIVANSKHAYLPIATDIIIGKIAESIGFLPLEINILKRRNGRTQVNNFLRETAVFLQKPVS